MKAPALILAILLCALPVVADDADTAIARKALDAALAGDHATFSSMATDTVNAALSKEALASVGATLEFQFGTYAGVTGVESSMKDGYRIHTFTLDYERSIVKVRVVLDGDSKVAGLSVAGVEEKVQWAPPSYADPAAFREEDVVVGTGNVRLPGTISIPKSEGKHPAVVLLHGSGPNDRDETIGPNRILKDIAWGLATRGLVVLRYDKRTRAMPSAFDPATGTLDDEVIDDAVAAVALLRDRPEVDSARIFVLGHSLGGVAAPYVAKRDGAVAGTIAVAAPGRPLLDVIAYQIEHLAKLENKWDDEAKAEVARVRRIAAAGRKGEKVPDETILASPARYWIDVDSHDGAKVAAGTKTPILVIQGGRDYQVTMDCFAAWKEALDGKDFATLVVFDDLNHLMIAGEGASTPAEYQKTGHVDERVVSAIADWIGKAGKP